MANILHMKMKIYLLNLNFADCGFLMVNRRGNTICLICENMFGVRWELDDREELYLGLGTQFTSHWIGRDNPKFRLINFLSQKILINSCSLQSHLLSLASFIAYVNY